MQRAVIASIAIAASVATPATAADILYQKTPIMKVAPAQAPLWGGFYIGANAGYGWTRQSGISGDGGFGGGQIGYNWQTNRFVLGIEADLQGGALSGSSTSTLGALTISETEKMKMFGTVRGRIGYAYDRWLPYFTAGYAYASVHHDGSGVTGVTGTYSASNTLSGYALGGGLEYALSDHWSAKLEYLYMSFAGHNNTYTTTTPAIAVTYGRLNTNIVRAGFNYRF